MISVQLAPGRTIDCASATTYLSTDTTSRCCFYTALRDLYWLPVQQRITCLLMRLVHSNRAPSYLADSVIATANLSGRTRLRSASSLRYEQPRTRLKFGERCFVFAGPAAWNSLPSSIQQLSDTESFKRHLKTVLFQRCYGSIV